MYERWLELKKQKDAISAAMIAEEAVIFTHLKNQLKDEGSTTINEGPYRVKVITRMNRSIDQAGAEQIGGLGLAKKYSWSKTEYSKLSDEQKHIVNAVVTSKPGKPTFKVEVNNEG